ncbi:MAG: Anti-sigma factor antagonist [Acidimicrobiaceae bacterium]|jgi:anti-sigma B factor antagonist|nr:Anti-sigma factor antagonist [Acidimicrobiaceae bacterium]
MEELELERDGTRGSVEVLPDISGRTVIKLSGEIDISNAGLVGATVGRFVEGTSGTLVFDLTDLQFMDSSGIALLLRASAHRGGAELRGPSPTIRRVIEATGLSSVLRFEP